jgi:hypothetical protein
MAIYETDHAEWSIYCPNCRRAAFALCKMLGVTWVQFF